QARAALRNRDGAAGDVRRRPRARREEQGHARDPTDRPREGGRGRAARSVRPRLRRRQARAGLPAGKGRQAGLDHGDVRGAAAGARQLALGGRAVLPAHRPAARDARGVWVEQGWALLEPVLAAWSRTPAALPTYEAGSWGPPEADAFIARDGGAWRQP